MKIRMKDASSAIFVIILFLTEIFYKITHILGLTLIQRTSNTFCENNFNLSIFSPNPSKVLFLSLYICYVKHNGAIIHTLFLKERCLTITFENSSLL